MPAIAVKPSPDDPRTIPAGPADGPASALPRPGDRVGRYKLGKKLGAGGMGAVFQAVDLDLRRPVALKLMLPEVAADPGSRTRFLREARAAAAVAHDHVVTIYQVGEHRRVPFLAMQYLKGCSLAQYLKAKPAVSVRQAVRLGREIALGLAAAHARGLTHRDVKPANVWLESPHGRVKLLDFGLAKRGTGADGLTLPGTVLGTPGYMAPEQARGKPVDHRADLFSLGAVLYELLALRPPFQRATLMETLTAAANDDPPPVRSANPDVPAELAELVHRLLAKEPDARPRSAAAVAESLKRIEKGLADRPASRPVVRTDDEPDFEVLDTSVLDALAVDPPPVTDEVDLAYVQELTARRRRRNRTRYGLLAAAGLLAAVAAFAVRGWR